MPEPWARVTVEGDRSRIQIQDLPRRLARPSLLCCHQAHCQSFQPFLSRQPTHPYFCNHQPVAGRHYTHNQPNPTVKMQFALLVTFAAAAMALTIPQSRSLSLPKSKRGV